MSEFHNCSNCFFWFENFLGISFGRTSQQITNFSRRFMECGFQPIFPMARNQSVSAFQVIVEMMSWLQFCWASGRMQELGNRIIDLISKIIGFDLPQCGILYIRVLKLSISTPHCGKGARRARVTFLSGSRFDNLVELTSSMLLHTSRLLLVATYSFL